MVNSFRCVFHLILSIFIFLDCSILVSDHQLAAHRDFRGPVFSHLLGIDMIIALPTNDDDLLIDIDRVINLKD